MENFLDNFYVANYCMIYGYSNMAKYQHSSDSANAVFYSMVYLQG